MARRRVAEFCLVCSELPCACKKSKKQGAKLGTKRLIDKSSVSESRADITPTSGQTGQNDVLRKRSISENLIGTDRPIEDLVEEDAIRNLAPLLAESELSRFGGILTTQPTTEDRLRIWRYRHEEASNGR